MPTGLCMNEGRASACKSRSTSAQTTLQGCQDDKTTFSPYTPPPLPNRTEGIVTRLPAAAL